MTHSHGLAQKQITSWLVHSWSTFGVRTNHGQIQTHKTHHGPDLGKPSPSPLEYTMCMATGPAPKCHFVSGLQSESLEIPTIMTFTTLGAHNFACRPPIEMRSQAKL